MPIFKDIIILQSYSDLCNHTIKVKHYNSIGGGQHPKVRKTIAFAVVFFFMPMERWVIYEKKQHSNKNKQ